MTLAPVRLLETTGVQIVMIWQTVFKVNENKELPMTIPLVRQKLPTIVGRALALLRGSRDGYAMYFNTPIKFIEGEWFVNERLVEMLFVHNQIAVDGEGRRALEFGCTKSHLALELCSLGYQVVGVDLREYPFNHPNLRFTRCNLLEFEDDAGFDLITTISVLEHIGLGAYGEGSDSADLARVLGKLAELLKSDGTLIVTVPVGTPNVDSFLRSFGVGEFEQLLAAAGLSVATSRLFVRQDFKYWYRLGPDQVPTVPNDPDNRGHTGVNGVGCFVIHKTGTAGDIL